MFPPSELTEEKLSVQSAPITSCIADQISPQNGLKEHDKVYSLPGQPKGVKFNQYAGYVNVDSKAGRALFYYFVESPKHTAHKPLVLWLNGGPGCSSIDGGAFQELGPFRVNRDGKTLHWNKYAWNKEANIIFLESPAGVGFSYSNTTSDYQTSGDKRTAHDSYIFLINWLERFPEYKGRDFYITGESYGGHYVPQLAKLVLDNNKCDTKTKINLKGIAMGNALIDSETWIKGQVDFYWTHALISDEIYSGLISNCNFSSLNNLSAACQNFANLAQNASGNINPYMIYAPLCKSPSSYVPDGTIDPCTYIYLDSYMNLPEVQAALHANVTKLPYPWRNCSSQINQNWKDRPETVLPLIEELMGSGLPVWLYSGDVDGVVPVTSTRYGVNKMKLPVMTPWYPWYTSGEVGGYAEGYGNLTFVTVRGAGHLVPSYQPARALALFTSFIMHKLPPTN